MAASLRDRIALAARRAVAEGRLRTGGLTETLSRPRGQVVILCYHRVLDDAHSADNIDPGMYVRASTLEDHVRWIRERWPIVRLSEALESRDGGSGPRFVFTFDDGWRDNLTHAWPRLRSAGVRPMVFLVRDWVERGTTDRGEFMRPDEVRAAAGEGLEFGAHTVAHPRLDEIDVESARREMRDSRQAVVQWTGEPCDYFAYPYGAHSAATADAARTIFRASVITGDRWSLPGDDPATIPRVCIHQDMTDRKAMFLARLSAAEA